jgi:hypothetical protein
MRAPEMVEFEDFLAALMTLEVIKALLTSRKAIARGSSIDFSAAACESLCK